jgi:hypothetical protein
LTTPVHIKETCEDDLPYLITHVDATIGPAADGTATPRIHAALQQRGLLPGTHIVDTGFLDADLLVESQEHYGVDLLGPHASTITGKPARACAKICLTPSARPLANAPAASPAEASQQYHVWRGGDPRASTVLPNPAPLAPTSPRAGDACSSRQMAVDRGGRAAYNLGHSC